MKDLWHLMADEEPTDESAAYVLAGMRGTLYLAKGYHVWEHTGSKSFYIPNNRSGYMDFDRVKAWMKVPKFEAMGDEYAGD